MRVGFVTMSVSRLAGGLYYSVRELARAVGNAGVVVSVFAAEDRCTARDLAEWQGIDVRLFKHLGPGSFGYLPGLGAALAHEKLDILHTQGIWQYPSVAALRWSRRSGQPYVISPRGMLDSWALSNSAIKKKLALAAYERMHLEGAAFIHALNALEADAVRRFSLINPIVTIPNGAVLDDRPRAASPGTRTLLFIGRIHPKKGLESFLRAWSVVKRGQPGCPWRLVIAGWDQGGHEAELRQLAQTLGCQDSVAFVGSKYRQAKDDLLRKATAFVLPSLSEGLPMAVLEAWSAGLPALLTRACNLLEGYQAGAATELPCDPHGMAMVLSSFLASPEEDLQRMGENGRELVRQRFAWPFIGRRFVEAYRAALTNELRTIGARI